MTNARIFFFGGLTSYRALFSFLSWQIFLPTLILTPIFQILLFAYIGKAAGLRSAEFYVLGNAIQHAAVPCLFAMTQTIADERYQQTLGYLVISPAARLPLFLGRALPVILNGAFVALFSLVVGGALLGVTFSLHTLGLLALVVVVATFSCTGLGLVNAGLGLRLRETAVLSNVLVGILLIFSGANVPLSSLPGPMAAFGRVLPMTHAIEAARIVARTGSLAGAGGLLWREAAIGLAYTVVGISMIRLLEWESRRLATLERI